MRRRLAAFAGTAIFALAFSVTPALAASDDGGRNLTCTGGTIAAGTYDSITVTGMCWVDAGSITVRNDLVVKNGGGLIALFGGSNVTVRGDLRVQKNGILALGCGMPASFCLNDPAYGNTTGILPTLLARGRVGHDLTADNALAVIVHNTRIAGNLSQRGGGGGLDCTPVLMGSPAYSTYEESSIGGSVSITGLQTCWLGFLHNTVGHNVIFNSNRTIDLSETTGLPDGNELAGNTIRGNLSCRRNSPAPQFGDSPYGPNVVRGDATGQCAGLKA